MSRADLAAEVARLRAQGRTHREIAVLLGISRSYTSDLDVDPDRSRQLARREKYRRPCPGCGALMDGSNGTGPRAPKFCAACRAAAPPRSTDPDEILEQFQEFHAVVGRSPTTLDTLSYEVIESRTYWRLSREKKDDLHAARAKGVWLHAPGTVRRAFGSWKAAVAAAGLPPAGYRRLKQSRPPIDVRAVAALRQGPLTAGDLSKACGYGYRASVRRYLAALIEDGTIITRQESNPGKPGYRVIYSLADTETDNVVG